jgi:ubiquitin C-terminal hydrolase
VLATIRKITNIGVTHFYPVDLQRSIGVLNAPDASYSQEKQQCALLLFPRLMEKLIEITPFVEKTFMAVTRSVKTCLTCHTSGNPTLLRRSTMIFDIVSSDGSIEEKIKNLSNSVVFDGQNMISCDACKILTPSQKRETLDTISDVFVVNVYHPEKFTLTFSPSIDIASIMTDPSHFPGDYHFDVVGVIVHDGSIAKDGNGHYISFFLFNKKWWRSDDLKPKDFKSVTWEKMVAETKSKNHCPAMVFYRRATAPSSD